VSDKLAIVGGDPVTREPFPPWPQLSERAIGEAADTLRSGRLTYWAGPKSREFEKRWAEWADSPHAVSCSSGSAALHTALVGLGIQESDEVIVPSHSFIATTFAVIQAGGRPVFCDVAGDHTIDPRRLEVLITPRTRAVIVVHLFGVVCDMDPILRLATEKGLAVIEDCAQCVGGEYRGKKAGTLGEAGCFSFSQTKHLTTGGEGGMLVTSSESLAREFRSIRDHGYDVEGWLAIPAGGEQPPAPHRRVGYNYRLTEAQSAIGLAELARLDSWNLPRRLGYAKIYDHAFHQLYGVGGLPFSSDARRSAYWQYPLELELEKLTCGADGFREALAAEGVPCSTFKWREAYEEPVFGGITEKAPASRGGVPGQAPRRMATAERLRQRTLVLFLHPSWERSHIELCIAAVKKVLHAFKR
jgi:dTDP-4-amino-4,6-dideoxygalactose transaminase